MLAKGESQTWHISAKHLVAVSLPLAKFRGSITHVRHVVSSSAHLPCQARHLVWAALAACDDLHCIPKQSPLLPSLLPGAQSNVCVCVYNQKHNLHPMVVGLQNLLAKQDDGH